MHLNSKHISQRYKQILNTSHVLLLAVALKTVLVCIAYILPLNLLQLSGNQLELFEFAPEAWLSLLAFVVGTLIIVISIASERTPKLIDLFVSDYWSRLFIWLITFSSVENIFLRFIHSRHGVFIDNWVLLNNYILLPLFVLAAIPYIFYIIKYTRISNIINKLYDENLRMIKVEKNNMSINEKNENHFQLFDTVNQLHDLFQYIAFREPKADIIHRFGKSLRFYLTEKKKFPSSYFLLSQSVKKDVSFKTLSDKYAQIGDDKIFYEQKIFRVLGTSYLLLMRDSHYDLASLCGSELFETAKRASQLNDQRVVDSIIIHFNTLLRFGINHGLKNREIRNVHNTIFHYSQLLIHFINTRQEEKILQCCRYYYFYAQEVGRLSIAEPQFKFLIEAFAIELKKALITLHTNNFPRTQQLSVLKMFNDVMSKELKRSAIPHQNVHSNALRIIQINLCLFYVYGNEQEFTDITVDTMIKDLSNFTRAEVMEIISEHCDRIKEQSEEFWEETDQGSKNIYYSPYTSEMPKFISYIFSKIEFTTITFREANA